MNVVEEKIIKVTIMKKKNDENTHTNARARTHTNAHTITTTATATATEKERKKQQFRFYFVCKLLWMHQWNVQQTLKKRHFVCEENGKIRIFERTLCARRTNTQSPHTSTLMPTRTHSRAFVLDCAKLVRILAKFLALSRRTHTEQAPERSDDGKTTTNTK